MTRRIAFFGSSLVSAYWNGAATYYRGLLRALAEHGWDVTFYEPDAYDRQKHRDLATDPDYARVVVYGSEQEREALLDRAFEESDWVVKCSGVGIWDAELEEGLGRRAAATADVRAAFWDVDAPATLASIAGNADAPLRAALPHLEHVFTYGGGPPVVERYRELGARACTPIYNALDPAEHRPAEGVERQWDLLFMGNRLPDREARVDEFFFRVAEASPQHRFALGGAGWDDRPMPPNVDYLGHVPTERHNALNGAARFVLNVHRESMVRNGWSPATRMFEAAGAGACQITDAWVGIEDFFEPGSEILVARDGPEVAALLREVDDAAAANIGRAARARALADHTYESRAVEVDRLLSEPRLEVVP